MGSTSPRHCAAHLCRCKCSLSTALVPPRPQEQAQCSWIRGRKPVSDEHACANALFHLSHCYGQVLYTCAVPFRQAPKSKDIKPPLEQPHQVQHVISIHD